MAALEGPTEGTMPDHLPFDLDVLRAAERYQRWIIDRVRPVLGRRTMEIGSGTGNMSRWLPVGERLVLTEADESLLPHLRLAMERLGRNGDGVSVERFDPTADAPDRFLADRLDTVVAFNVLEHILDHERAVQTMAAALSPDRADGPRRLVLLVPAHPWAYGSLDERFGHVRRYTRTSLRRVLEGAGPSSVAVAPFNLMGLPGWALLSRGLRRREISAGAVRSFERLCPVARHVDHVAAALGLSAGQSLIGVAEWR